MIYRYKGINNRGNNKGKCEWVIVVLAVIMILIVGYDITNVINSTRINRIEENNVREVINYNSGGGFKESFKNDLFFGDSITKGLCSYKILDESNVYAKVGASIRGVGEEVDKAATLKPERIFVMCGINDMDNTLTPERFTKNYTELVDKVKEKFPTSKIYVQSILPVLPEVAQKKTYMKSFYINKYNDIIREISKKEGVAYVDTASVLNDSNRDLYGSDGIHFKAEFYTVWLKYLLKNVK